jgi:hypothetical protein
MFDLTQTEGIPTSQIGQLTSADLANDVLSGEDTELIDPGSAISATTPTGTAGTPAQAVQAFINAGGTFLGTSSGGASGLAFAAAGGQEPSDAGMAARVRGIGNLTAPAAGRGQVTTRTLCRRPVGEQGA